MTIENKNRIARSVVFYADARSNISDVELIKNQFYALKKRFHLNISLIINSLGDLDAFDVSRLYEEYGIGDVHVSGNSIYTFSDAVAVAMRVKTASVYLCSLSFLSKNFNDIIRFIFDTDSAANTHTDTQCVGDMYCLSVTKLRTLNFNYIGYSSSHFYNCLRQTTNGIEPSVGKIESVEKPLTFDRKQVFISEAAVQRMFGLERMLTFPLLFDGTAIRDYSEIYIVGTREITLFETGTKKTKSFLKGSSYDIDIYPAPSVMSGEVPTDMELKIPRTILRIHTSIAEAVLKASENDRVGYIMSNYNKSNYIAASILSILSQFHKNITIFFWDDVSSDHSKSVVEGLLKYVDLSKVNIIWNFSEVNRGTYWIRNDIIYRSKSSIDYYFINDSDDYSSARRTEFQLQRLNSEPGVEVVMVDIVRTDGNYKLLSMNNEIERYGTATTAFRSGLIDKIGYFQVFRKNTDTEFIERVKTFIGEAAVVREHYPGLYQTFDGTNLTSDIYTISDGNSTIEVSTGLRGVHDLLWRKHHSRLILASLPSHFSFPESTIPGEFKRLDRSFFVDGYDAFDSVGVYINNRSDISDDLYEQMKKTGYLLIYCTEQGDYIFEKNGQENFSTDLDFVNALSAYLDTHSFHGYIISLSFLAKTSDFKKSPGSLLKSNLRDFVHKSKSTGDKSAFDLTGSVLSKSVFARAPTGELKFFASYSSIASYV